MILQEGQIILRPIETEDAVPMAKLANNKNISDQLRDIFPHPYTMEDATRYIHKAMQEDPQVTFAIEYEGNFCGIIGLNVQQDVHRRSAEIGYWIGEPYWNKGIARTSIKLATDYGLYHLDLLRIYADVFEFNTASMRVLQHNGYLKEGVFRKAVLKNGQVWDDHRYAIVK